MDDIVQNFAANPYAQAFAIVAALATILPSLWRGIRWSYRFIRTTVVEGLRASVARYFGVFNRRAVSDYKDIRLIVTSLYNFAMLVLIELIMIWFFIIAFLAPGSATGSAFPTRGIFLATVYLLGMQVVFNTFVSLRYVQHVRRLTKRRARRLSR